MVARATCLFVIVSGTALDGGIHFPDMFLITVNASTLDHVLNFGSLAYIADCYGEIHSLDGARPMATKYLALPTPSSLLGADLKVLA